MDRLQDSKLDLNVPSRDEVMNEWLEDATPMEALAFEIGWEMALRVVRRFNALHPHAVELDRALESALKGLG